MAGTPSAADVGGPVPLVRGSGVFGWGGRDEWLRNWVQEADCLDENLGRLPISSFLK